MVAQQPTCALLQEPRHSAGSIRRTAERVREAGYSPLWGSLASGNSRRRQEVGLVAGLVRGRFAFTAPPPPTLARWASRVQHVVYAFGRGDRQVHFINIYGFSGARSNAATRAENESFLLAVFRYSDSLGDVPKFVVGDFNDEVETSTVLSVVTAGGRYVDLVASAASARGDAAPP